MKKIHRISILFTLLALTMSVLGATPVRAQGNDSAQTAKISPEELLNPDGSLRLDSSFSGSLDLEGWDVQLDPQRGPLLAPNPGWNNLGSRTDGALLSQISVLAFSGTDLYVGGYFTNVGDIPEADYIAKWDGVNWSALGSNGAGNGALTSGVRALAVSNTGDLYVGGGFTNVNNNGVLLPTADYVAKWNGANWSALGSNGAGNGALDNFVNALAVSSTGELYVGGIFENAGGIAEADFITKWDGTNWSALGSNGAGDGALSFGYIYSLAVNDTYLYVAGYFNNAGGIAEADHIARWDGANWSALGSNGAGNGALDSDSDVYALVVSGTDLYVGGYFTNAGGIAEADHIAKWDTVAENWSALGSNGFGDGTLNNSVRALAVSDTGDLYVGGFFTNIGGIAEADYIANWDGTDWLALGSDGAGNGALNDYVNALAVSDTGDVYAGGDFTNVVGITTADYTARWDASAANWSALGSRQDGLFNSSVYALAISGTDVYVGGYFENVGGIAEADYIVKWDTLTETWSALGADGFGGGVLNAPVYSLVMSGTGDLYVGGGFTNAGGIAEADYIAKWDGANWSALGSNGAGNGALNAIVRALAVNDTDLYVGGGFTNVGGIAEADYIAKWDGANWTALGSNGAGSGALNGYAYALAVGGTDLYVGGYFTNAGGIAYADKLAKWDGANWSALGSNGAGNGALSGSGSVYALVVSGTDLYVGGRFANAGGVAEADCIAKWNGATWLALGSDGAGNGALGACSDGNLSAVYALAISGTDLYVGGGFGDSGGFINPDSIAKWDGAAWSAFGSNGAGDGALAGAVNTLAVSGIDVYVGGEFTDAGDIPAADFIALYHATIHLVTYNGNDNTSGMAPSSQNKMGGIDLVLATNTRSLMRTGYALTGWNTAADGTGDHYDLGGMYTTDADITLYAEWTPDTTAPQAVSIVRGDASPTNAASVDFTVTFSEVVNGVDAGDFAFTKTGSISGYAVKAVNPGTSASTYTVTVSTGKYNGTLRLDLVDNDSITDLAGNALNGGYITGEAYTIKKSYTVNLPSIAAQDGWVLESGENTNIGGTLNTGTTTLRLGDDAAKKQYRAILSFSTGAGLPDNAVITAVTLKVKRQGVAGGGNPISIFQGFVADIKKGTFGTSALEITDFQAAASKTYGPFSPSLVGGWYTLNLTTGKAYINKLSTSSGLTQIRLRFKLDDNDDTVANYLSLYSGNVGAANKPQLIIQYYVP